VKKKDREILEKRELEILERLENEHVIRSSPMLGTPNLTYEMSDRTNATAWGGVAVMYELARRVGLVKSLDDKVHVLKIHKPYHESDHIMSLALNVLAGGTCLEDLEFAPTGSIVYGCPGRESNPRPDDRRRLYAPFW